MTPLNRYLLIEPIKEAEPEQESFVLVPDTYKPKSPYVQAKVLDFAHDCKINIRKNQIVIVDNSMIQEIDINKETNFLVLENYVVGVVQVPLKEVLRKT